MVVPIVVVAAVVAIGAMVEMVVVGVMVEVGRWWRWANGGADSCCCSCGGCWGDGRDGGCWGDGCCKVAELMVEVAELMVEVAELMQWQTNLGVLPCSSSADDVASPERGDLGANRGFCETMMMIINLSRLDDDRVSMFLRIYKFVAMMVVGHLAW
ncbi:hypothetical protein HanRHA438_Chr17g0815641 [Helianthus annuus]|nr:hypothetical protein HanRHA438_Chr17g0815641 [Helianthus annuus]